MKIFITELLLIFLLCVGVIFPQENPDYNPYARKININPPRYSINGVSTYWTTVSPSPNAVSRSASAYVELPGVGYFIYQFGGGSDLSLTSVARYNIATDTWESTGFQPIPAPMSAATAITIGTKIYLFGGEKYTGLGKTFVYDAAAGTWDNTNYAMSNLVTDAAVVKYSDNYVLVIGGGNGYFPGPTSTYAYSDQVQLFDVNNLTYSVLAGSNYPLKAAMMGAGIFNDTIICAGGLVSTGTSWSIVDSVYKGIITKNTSGKPISIRWTQLPLKYPGGPITRMAATTIRKANGVGILFTGGALNGSDAVPFTYIWDLVNYRWSTLPDLPLGRANMKASFAPIDTASYAYVVAGYSSIGTGQTDKLTILSLVGSSFPLNAFNLVTPTNGSTITSIAGNITPIPFNWDTSATGASYRVRFRLGSTVYDTTVYQNLFKITSGDLDKLLSRLGLGQGDAVTGDWDVMAFKGPGTPGNQDSVSSSNGPWALTLKRNQPVLAPFNLFLPVNNTTIITSKLNNFPVNFVWNKSVEGTNYKVFYASPSFDSLKFIKFRFTANSSGLDSTFSLLNSALDSLLNTKLVARGDSLVGQWRVYAYSRTDSLASANTFNLTLRRTPFNVTTFNLIAPPTNTTITLSNFSVVNFNWNVAGVGATYKWSFVQGSNTLTLPSNNNSFDTNLTITTTSLDALIPAGTTVSGTWKVYAFKGIDSLPSAQSFNITFNRLAKLPLYQTFDSSQFPPIGWNVDFTGINRWLRETPNTNPAAKFDYFNSPAGTVQALVTNVFPPSVNVQKQGTDSLLFDYAHAFVSNSNIDSMFVFYSIDGGVTYTLLKDANFGSNPVPKLSLSTVTYTAGPYSPGPGDWDTKILPLPDKTNRIKFVVKSGWGNNLFLDNIRLKNRPPNCILPPDQLRSEVKSPLFTWNQSFIAPGYPNTYKFQLWTDTTYTDPAKLIKEYTSIDSGLYQYPDALPIDVYYGWRVSILNQGGQSRFTIDPNVFYVDSLFPLNQKFDGPVFPQVCWRINTNGIPNTFWSRDSTVGVGDNFSAKYNFFSAPPLTTEELISNTYTPTLNGDTILFDCAHAYAGNFNIDSLFVYYSVDEGKNWKKFDTARYGSNPNPNVSLSTATLFGSPFVPNASQWTQKVVIFPPTLASVDKIKFVVISGQGNNLYLDNIRTRSGIPLTLEKVPTTFKLNYNYPNPFNPTTTISFSIPKTAYAKLIIYDVLGREVNKLVNQTMLPGDYKVTFDGRNLSSGVYFYRLEAGDFVDVKKMLLIK